MSTNTTFRFKATKVEGEGKDLSYQVDLNQGILDNVKDEDIIALATQAKIVEVQNHKSSLLRTSANAEEALKCLREQGYPNATVTPYTPGTTTVTDAVVKKVLAGLTREQLEAKLKELG